MKPAHPAETGIRPDLPEHRYEPAGRDADEATAAVEKHAAIVESVERSAGARRPAPPRATFLRSFVYAASGLWYALRTQRNMRVHLAFAVAALTLGVALSLSPVELAVLVVTIGLVSVAEMVNTVAEACVDLATQEYHPLAKVAKDVAAGAVLLAAALAVAVGLIIFLPHLWPLALHLLGR